MVSVLSLSSSTSHILPLKTLLGTFFPAPCGMEDSPNWELCFFPEMFSLDGSRTENQLSCWHSQAYIQCENERVVELRPSEHYLSAWSLAISMECVVSDSGKLPAE